MVDKRMNGVGAMLRLMRPTQWIKNGFVLMPLVFSARLTSPDDVVTVLILVAAFCLASSATYVINDYMDMEQDKVHPLKKDRPLARGDLAPQSALLLAFGLVVAVFLIAVAVKAPLVCHLCLAAYLVIQVLYSLVLKHVVILDVLTISAGFLLRVLAGAFVIQVSVSSWLILCTFSVAILLALGKRRHEVMFLSDDAASHRPVLENYSVGLLDQLVQIAATSTFIFYCLYSVRGKHGPGFDSELMMVTIPIVTYGLFRYMYLIYHREDGGSPTRMLLTDPPLLLCTIVWILACIAVIYL
jgi:4-hydroxybenzoate polyprenyltransferase